jgi:putative YphP/YqiW family bacilliredoxin
MYPSEIVNPCREELTSNGFNSLESAEQVENILHKNEGTVLMVVNSVCGCAARGARPGVIKSLQNEKKPSSLTTVFAGVDQEAVAKAREHFMPYPPSSPSIALFKDGKLVHFIERYQIEGTSDQVLADHLKAVYNEFCN